MKRPSVKEIIELLKKEENPEVVADAMENFINIMTFDKKEFIEALKNEEPSVMTKFTVLSLLWLKKMNHYYNMEYYDERNLYAVRESHHICNQLGEDFKNYANYSGYLDNAGYLKGQQADANKDFMFAIRFVEHLGRTHRTLQQKFSEIVFQWLSEVKNVLTNMEFVEVSTIVQKQLGC